MKSRYSDHFLNHVLWLQDEFATYYVRDRFDGNFDTLGVELKTFFDHREASQWLKGCVDYDHMGMTNIRSFLTDFGPHRYELHRWDDFEVRDEAARVIMDFSYPVIIRPLFEPPELASDLIDVFCDIHNGVALSAAVRSNAILAQAAGIVKTALGRHMRFADDGWNRGQKALGGIYPFDAKAVPDSWGAIKCKPCHTYNPAPGLFCKQSHTSYPAPGLTDVAFQLLEHSNEGWKDPSTYPRVFVNALFIIAKTSMDALEQALKDPLGFFIIDPIKEFVSIFEVPTPDPNLDKSHRNVMGRYKLNHDIHPDDLDSADHPGRVQEWMRNKRNQLDSASAIKGRTWPTPEQAEQILAGLIMALVIKKSATAMTKAKGAAIKRIKKSFKKNNTTVTGNSNVNKPKNVDQNNKPDISDKDVPKTTTNKKKQKVVQEEPVEKPVYKNRDFPTTTKPSGQRGDKPYGKKTPWREQTDPEVQRSLIRENEAADTLAYEGYIVEQNPKVKGKDPDYRIEGKIFDCYAPKTNGARSILGRIAEEKIAKKQTRRIVLNLADSDVKRHSLRQALNDNPISGLREIIIIDKYNNVTRFFP